MKFTELNGRSIKKSLGIKKTSMRYHNKNNSGGNFGINVYDVSGVDCEISGLYDTDGKITRLSFGRLYANGVFVDPDKSFEGFMDFIRRVTYRISEKEAKK